MDENQTMSVLNQTVYFIPFCAGGIYHDDYPLHFNYNLNGENLLMKHIFNITLFCFDSTLHGVLADKLWHQNKGKEAGLCNK